MCSAQRFVTKLRSVPKLRSAEKITKMTRSAREARAACHFWSFSTERNGTIIKERTVTFVWKSDPKRPTYQRSVKSKLFGFLCVCVYGFLCLCLTVFDSSHINCNTCNFGARLRRSPKLRVFQFRVTRVKHSQTQSNTNTEKSKNCLNKLRASLSCQVRY